MCMGAERPKFIVLPALMDGVPFVSQEPIPPNGKFHYQFPLRQSGTYCMHSHFGLQEQSLGNAPLILQTKEQQAKADEQYVVLLDDFSFDRNQTRKRTLFTLEPRQMPPRNIIQRRQDKASTKRQWFARHFSGCYRRCRE
jgi:FtsP/CotA-like multicopper oxidase with cupredoxin domain